MHFEFPRSARERLLRQGLELRFGEQGRFKPML